MNAAGKKCYINVLIKFMLRRTRTTLSIDLFFHESVSRVCKINNKQSGGGLYCASVKCFSVSFFLWRRSGGFAAEMVTIEIIISFTTHFWILRKFSQSAKPHDTDSSDNKKTLRTERMAGVMYCCSG